ncbi:uncharacterized protein LOC142522647 [Primulina tabacum]|uniref:uncharacterized protein LOC142522647 n=1 Tax=Primulina tabacum TaxID=48773 RepID=UPI003F5AAC9F
MAESLEVLSPFTEDNLIRVTLSFLFSDPLFLTFLTFYAVVLLYFPSLFLSFALSPVLISTAVLLLSLLRFGATDPNPVPLETEGTHDGPDCLEFDSTETGSQDFDDQGRTRIPSVSVANGKHGFLSSTYFSDSFVEWDVRAPLEVIYEEHEGQEAEEDEGGVSMKKRESQMNVIQRYASLSLFYPDSDSDSDSDNSSEGDSTAISGCDSPQILCFQWEDVDDRDGLIEIALDEKRISEFDEENLIEIDLSTVHFR